MRKLHLLTASAIALMTGTPAFAQDSAQTDPAATQAGALNIITAIPAGEQPPFRVDGGYHKRDGFATDVNTDRKFNNLDRFFVRDQVLYENADLTAHHR